MPKKTVAKSAVSKKKVAVKSGVSKGTVSKTKKVKMSEEDKYIEENSRVEIRNDKCVVVLTKYPDSCGFDDGLGFVTILMMEGFLARDINFKDPYESLFTYDKKHYNKMKEVEKKYQKGGYIIDAGLMAQLMLILLRLLPLDEYTPSKVVLS